MAMTLGYWDIRGVREGSARAGGALLSSRGRFYLESPPKVWLDPAPSRRLSSGGRGRGRLGCQCVAGVGSWSRGSPEWGPWVRDLCRPSLPAGTRHPPAPGVHRLQL